MHEMKGRKLKSGRSGKRVKSRKQAIAIGLSEATASGGEGAEGEDPTEKGVLSRHVNRRRQEGTLGAAITNRVDVVAMA